MNGKSLGNFLDKVVKEQKFAIHRKGSPYKTKDCPMRNPHYGYIGEAKWIETDESLRKRIKE